jgi:phage repressor protein C with HTH and peptisase S24 domain
VDEAYTSCAESEPFALRVMGDSMEPEFRDGAVIIIDPSAKVAHESYVLAVQGEEYIFRQLHMQDGEMYLKALNATYPNLPLPGGLDDVKGVVVQQAGRRRADRKRYD